MSAFSPVPLPPAQPFRRRAALYRALAAFLERPADELARTIPPGRAAALLRYHRREALRRAEAEALARVLGVPVAEVYLSCVPAGAGPAFAALEGDLDPRPAAEWLPAGA